MKAMNIALIDAHVVVRSASIYIVVALTAVASLWRRPSSRVIGGALLAFAWNLTALLIVNLLAVHAGWWRFEADGGLLLGVPVDLLLAWAWLWGALPALALFDASMWTVIALTLAFDLAMMPAGQPVIQLGDRWLAGELAGVLAALVPAQLLARWMAMNERLEARASLQMLAFAGIALFIIPAIALDVTRSAWSNPLGWASWHVSIALQVLAVPVALGATAVQEFVTRGRGTPVPLDPPERLVTSGIYAYVRNPMQLSGTLLLAMLGALLGNPYVALGGIIAPAYAFGIAGWDEDEDLNDRFGEAWRSYRRGVRAWVPRWRPCVLEGQTATLYVCASCDMCREVARWFELRHVRALRIVAAEEHPTRTLERITYDPGDGSSSQSGVAAIARGLEHINLAWAFAGCVLRLPLINPLTQILVDACGGGPTRVAPAAQTLACSVTSAVKPIRRSETSAAS